MALKAIVEDLEQVEESLRDHYTETEEGKFVLAVESAGGYALEDVSGLKSSLEKERGQRQKLEKTIKDFDGLDPKAAREAMEKLEELSGLDPAKEADRLAEEKVKAREKQILEKAQNEIQEAKTTAERYRAALHNATVRDEAIKAIVAQKGIPDLLLPHVQRHLRISERDDGTPYAEVVDAEGNPRIADSKGTPMSVADLVREMRDSEIFGRAFEAEGRGGSGASPGPTNGGPKGKSRGEMTPKEKAEFIDKHGKDKYFALPA